MADRSDTSVLIIASPTKAISGSYSIKAHIKRPSKFAGVRVLNVGRATSHDQAMKVAQKVKADMVKDQGIPASNIKIRSTAH